MKGNAGIWILGFATSALVNLGAAAGLMAALHPQPVADQPVPESRLNVEAQEVIRSDATQQLPQTDSLPEAASKGAKLSNGAIKQSVAQGLVAPQERAKVMAPTPEIAVASVAVSPTVGASKPTVAKAPSPPIKSVKSTPTTLAAASIQRQQPITDSAAQTRPTLIASLPQSPDNATAPEQIPEVTSSKAMLAFPTSGPVDPVSLAAFQSFTQPAGTTGEGMRDTLSAALAIPCARMQVTFDPDTTTLRLTGHVPDASQRGPVLATLQAQMGADITVQDNLLVLPAPQCGALSGIANVGFPQSTDQITNPMIVGADTHARAFRYVAGDALVMTLTAPDYPAYVYVDYFDADGNVIHLAPNDATPLQAVTPKSVLNIGAARADAAGLFVTIGPPFGQEIAAAFASSVPLYEGNRPLVEPAGAYLEWLKERVADARVQHPDFKGEWVYFFVTTAAN